MRKILKHIKVPTVTQNPGACICAGKKLNNSPIPNTVQINQNGMASEIDNKKLRNQPSMGIAFTFKALFLLTQINFHFSAVLNKQPLRQVKEVVGVERFELPTTCSQSRCATRLRYTPIGAIINFFIAHVYPSFL